IQEVFRDKRTMALMFVAPLLILTLMYFLFNGETKDPTLGIIDLDSNLEESLEDADISLQSFTHSGDSEELIIDHKLDGLLEKKNDDYDLTLENSDTNNSTSLGMKISQLLMVHQQGTLMENISESLPDDKQPHVDHAELEKSYIYGSSDTDFFDVLGPILVGFFVFFFTFLISGIGLLKERTSDTLERMMATPIRKGEIITAYVAGYGIFAVVQTIIVVLYAVYVLDVVLVGSIWTVFLINIVLALVALSLGTLLSSFASSEFQMMQFIPLVIIPQIFFSGIIPIEDLAEWLQWFAKVMPLYYAATGLRGVMYNGFGLTDVIGDLAILGAFAVDRKSVV